jgi:hypothetical protein
MNLLLAACIVNALFAWPYLLMAVTLGMITDAPCDDPAQQRIIVAILIAGATAPAFPIAGSAFAFATGQPAFLALTLVPICVVTAGLHYFYGRPAAGSQKPPAVAESQIPPGRVEKSDVRRH